MNDSGLLILIILFLTLDILLLRNLKTVLAVFPGQVDAAHFYLSPHK